MKTKIEKVMELTPITMGIDKTRDEKFAKKWTHKGLDLLLNMWHTYYNDISHFCINSLLKFGEKQLNLDKLEECLKGINNHEVH